MPLAFWVVLFVLAIVTMILTGYDGGLSRAFRRREPDLLIATAFSLVLVLVIAMDRPMQGLVSISQRPFADLLNSMGAAVD